MKLSPKLAHIALWQDIIARRTSAASRLGEAKASLDMKAWPAPVVRMMLGEATPVATLTAADHPQPKTRTDQVCEVAFFSGQLALRGNEKGEAERLFRLAASECPANFVEWWAAKAELKALGASP